MSEQNIPFPICVGNTERKEYGGGIVFHMVPIHVGEFKNRGNCVASINLGGRGGIDSSKEAAEEFAAHIVKCVNSHESIVHALQTLLAGIEEKSIPKIAGGMVLAREVLRDIQAKENQ